MTDDEHDIRAVLDAWYVSMTAHDIPAVGAALTESFLLVEHDVLAGRTELLEMLSDGQAYSLDARLSDFQVSVEGDVAWSTHRNHEVYTPIGGETQELDFLETVVLVRRGGRWLIDRYHATRLAPTSL